MPAASSFFFTARKCFPCCFASANSEFDRRLVKLVELPIVYALYRTVGAAAVLGSRRRSAS